MDLYVERGFEGTTVADIAERAGVTPRTFFRHFADKREVLFAGSTALIDALVASVDTAPAGDSPLTVVATALESACEVIGGNRAYSARRQSVIAANPDLQERELIKMATLAATLATGLRDRGVTAADAGIAAEAGVAVFRISFERWVADDDDAATAEADLVAVLRDSFARLANITALG
ncbi:MAG: regulatory protein TetR [Marmoricola sp.]|nr:regulatory protein TetR [Marmoricola sp.]